MPDPEIELDRTYTVPLSRAWIAPRYKRTARAMNVLREFAERHMKSSEIKIDSDLNERMWDRGITKPPRRIKVRMTKDEDGLVTISLPKDVEEVEEEEETPEPKAAEKQAPSGDEGPEGSAIAEKKDTETTPTNKGSSETPGKKKRRSK